MKLRKNIFISLATILCLQSCASMFNGASEKIYVRTEADDAKIYINERYIGKNNTVTSIKKKGNYRIRVSKKGCDDAIMPINRTFDYTSLLGIFLDYGIISVLLVDGLITGAINKADQTDYIINPEC